MTPNQKIKIDGTDVEVHATEVYCFPVETIVNVHERLGLEAATQLALFYCNECVSDIGVMTDGRPTPGKLSFLLRKAGIQIPIAFVSEKNRWEKR